ncbi:MAG: hypothetical protein PHR81_05125 [Bacteroidales bacterium]|jgi:hypothetical protein|nr:hypothetical protein [Bacteroidales bacterium]MDD4214173.1 hypothetical protein [Bacteroidales bacterium]
MLDNLLNLVKENAGEAIINNPAIPNKKNDIVCKAATKSLMNKLQGVAKNDGLDSIKNLFQQGADAESNPVVNNISTGVAGDLMKKFKLDGNVAGTLVKSLIPVVMGQLINKTNDPNDNSFDLQDILGSLTGGGNSGGILGKLKGMFGG